MAATSSAGGRDRPSGAPLPVDEMYPAHAPDIAVHMLTIRDGLRLRVLESGPPDGRPVLLLHGWGASVYSWRDAIPAFVRAGFLVLAADLPGHGLSDKPADLSWYTRDSMVATAGALLDALDVRDATVVGVSMGGGVAAGLAVSHHPRVGRVALIDPVGFAPVRFTSVAQMLSPLAMRDYASYVVARPLVSWFLHLAYYDQSRVSERDVDEYWAGASRPGAAAALVACLHRFSWEPYTAEQLRSVACPVLLVIGTRDHLIAGSERTASAIPHLRVVRVEGGHAVNEERPDEVNAALIGFARE